MTVFRKVVYSGTCLCGHTDDDHHGSVVVDPEVAKVLGSRLPDECLAYGCNETGGLDEDGNLHCGGYVDREDPDERRRQSWSGTSR